MLGYLTERLVLRANVSTIVVATTTNRRDDVIVEEAGKLGVECLSRQ
jgi:spore coat polysaccharide biosynthesis protein SpsF (cytidylyltransferase family)